MEPSVEAASAEAVGTAAAVRVAVVTTTVGELVAEVTLGCVGLREAARGVMALCMPHIARRKTGLP